MELERSRLPGKPFTIESIRQEFGDRKMVPLEELSERLREEQEKELEKNLAKSRHPFPNSIIVFESCEEAT